MSYDPKSASTPPPSPRTKPSTFSAPEMLTPSELASLRQKAADDSAYLKKAFASLPKVTKPDQT